MNILIATTNSIPINSNSGYGGMERVVYYLIENLIKMNHKVYLFAHRDSKTSAILFPYPEYEVYNYIVNNIPEDTDIIHIHGPFLDFHKMYKKNGGTIPVLYTLHTLLPGTAYYRDTVYPTKFIRNKVLNIEGLTDTNIIHHGENKDDFIYNENKKDYLLYLAVLSEVKGVMKAIEIAEKSNMELKIAGPIIYDECYELFNNKIKPKLSDKIQYVGIVEGEMKKILLSEAKALLFMSSAEYETFGLTMIEAMLSGTPVLSLDKTTGREILGEKFKDYVSNDIDYLVAKLNDLPKSIDVYNYALENYQDTIMTEKYINFYNKLIIEGENKMGMQDYFNKANDHFYKGEYQEAVDNYILGINFGEITVHNIWLKRDAYNKMSQAYYNMGKLELAIYANDMVLKLDPESEYGIYNKKLFDAMMNHRQD